MAEGQPICVQGLPDEQIGILPLKLRVSAAVQRIAEERVPDARQMHADLVRSAGLQFQIQQVKAVKLLDAELRVASDRVKVTRAVLPDGYRVERKYKPIADTVASPRLDGVVAALCNLSREAAKEKITAGDVEQNYEAVERPDAAVNAGDAVSVRGVGKFCIDSVSDPTKKGRYRLLAKKYI